MSEQKLSFARVLVIVSSLLCWMSLAACSFCQTLGASAASYAVAGSVLNSIDSQPIEGAFVIIEPLEDRSTDASGAKTGPDGRFSVPNISAKKYRVIVERPGFQRFIQTFDHGANASSVNASSNPESTEVRMIPQAVIAGHISDPAGKPLMNATVQLSRVELQGLTTTMSIVNQTSTNDLGEYRIFGLPPGRYYVSAIFQDFAGMLGLRQRTPLKNTSSSEIVTEDYAATYYPGTSILEAATPVQLKPGAIATNIDIQIESAESFSVHGSVTDLLPTNSTLRVQLQPSRPGSLGVNRGYLVAPGNSAFHFKSVPPGDYVAHVDANSGKQMLSARQEISVTSRDVDNVILDLRPPFMITGSVSMNGNTAIPQNLALALYGNDKQSRGPIKPGADGSFQVQAIGPDRYNIRLTDTTGMIYIKSVTLDGQPVGANGVVISDANHVLHVELSDKGGRLEGVALNKDAHIIGGLAILARTEPQDVSTYAATINKEGRFTFQSLPPGKYRILCFSDLTVPEDATWDVQKKVKAEGKDIEVDEGTRQQLSLEFVNSD